MARGESSDGIVQLGVVSFVTQRIGLSLPTHHTSASRFICLIAWARSRPMQQSRGRQQSLLPKRRVWLCTKSALGRRLQKEMNATHLRKFF